MSSTHAFDQAMSLTPLEANLFAGRTTPEYWNMIGPFGGITAATLLRAVLDHSQCQGEPLSITVNFAAAVLEGEFKVQAIAMRTNRSTQHWSLSVLQTNAQGQEEVTTTATIITASRRETWSASDEAFPVVTPPTQIERATTEDRPRWFQSYDMRAVEGAPPQEWQGQESASRTRLWVRDEPPRPLDFCALTALADVFFPRVWLRRAKRVPAGTVSITVYFNAGSELLAATGTGYVLAQARAQEFRNGFFDQTAQLWNEAGVMLATSHQVVYYKE